MNKSGCKDHYGTKFEEMKKQRQRGRMQNYRNKFGKDELAKEKEKYAENPEKKTQ